ncbi:MAG: hypothetical protein ACODAD_13625 [Planctomycetota bacterium]
MFFPRVPLAFAVFWVCILAFTVIFLATRAGRTARRAHRGRALPLILRGLGCLIIVALVAMVCVRLDVVHSWPHRALGRRGGPPPTHIFRFGQHQRPKTEAVGMETKTVPDTATQSTPSADTPGGAAASDPEQIPLSSFQRIELGESEEPESADAELAPQRRAQVQIDFEARPEWVDQPDQDVGQVHRISIASGPFSRLRHARKELYDNLKTATDEYINEVVGHPHAAEWVGYDEDEVRRRFVAPDHYYDEKVVSPSFGPMQQSHALLEFGPQFHQQIEQAWHDVMARAQLIKVALGSAAVLAALVLLFGYFKTDIATGGSYSGRLKFVTIAAILSLIAAGFVIARSIPGLWL